MAKWNETGILRKKQVKDNYEDLLVFGYACKLFRDDEKALFIDQGKHLIPWMGDEKLKIDRYDCRGALSDLSPCEASKEGYDATRWLGLSESQRKIEQLCDEERYYALNTNEDEEAMYREEELKRKQANQFQYSYDVPKDPEQDNSQESAPTCEEEAKPFVPPTELDVPVDISIPKTVKENARIVKTALFVSKQGPQMEILIKAKQADNPQFGFMNQHDCLYKYYRHVLAAIKAGSYQPQNDADNKAEEETETSKDGDGTLASGGGREEHYLHPSLGQTHQSIPPSTMVIQPAAVQPTPPPAVVYKPTADCSYTQLITRIQQSSNATTGGTSSSSNASTNVPDNNAAAMPPSNKSSLQGDDKHGEQHQQQQQYLQYYYSMQYYEYYKQIAQQYATQAGCETQAILQNQQLQEQIQAQAAHYAQAACNQYAAQQQQPPPPQPTPPAPPAKPSTASNNPYAQIVTNLAPTIKNDVMKQVQNNNNNINNAAAVVATATTTTVNSTTTTTNTTTTNKLACLVHYSSDSEEEESDTIRTTYRVPPHDVGIVIDKMANYVSKNGADFENIVRAKGDPRFEFLHESHEYYKYYKHKLEEYAAAKTTPPPPPPPVKEKAPPKEKKVIAPVSFSIKKAKEETSKEMKSALPMEESSDDDEEAIPNPVAVAAATANVQVDVTQQRQQQPQQQQQQQQKIEEVAEPIDELPPVEIAINATAHGDDETNGCNSIDSEGILEMIDLTNENDDKRHVEASKSKQLERRKRAAMFLKMKTCASDSIPPLSTTPPDDCEPKDELSSSSTTKTEQQLASPHAAEILKIDDTDSENETTTSSSHHRRKSGSSSRKKKSHKRKSSRSSSSRHSSRSRHKKSKKRTRRKSSSHSSSSSHS